MPILKAVNSSASFDRAINYVQRKAALMVGINCRADFAQEEMNVTRAYYGKTGGRTYYHYVLSFPPDVDISPDKCAEITRKVVEANPHLHGHEVLIAVHKDTDHTHSHIIASSVRATDGKKYHITKPQYRAWIEEQQHICLEHGYEPSKKKEKTRGDFVTDDRLKYEVVRRKGREADVVVVYQAVERARKTANDWKEFEALLKENDVLIEYSSTRKHVVFGFNGHRFRDSNLSKTFSDSIDKETLNDEFCRNRQRRNEQRRIDDERRIAYEIAEREQDVSYITEKSLSSELAPTDRPRGRERTRY